MQKVMQKVGLPKIRPTTVSTQPGPGRALGR